MKCRLLTVAVVSAMTVVVASVDKCCSFLCCGVRVLSLCRLCVTAVASARCRNGVCAMLLWRPRTVAVASTRRCCGIRV